MTAPKFSVLILGGYGTFGGRIDVEIAAPMIGRIVRYRGWLERPAR